MNIHLEIFTGELETFMEEKAELVVAAIRRQMHVATGDLLAYIQDEKLSGQVLNQRSGNLKNSGFTEHADTAQASIGFVGFGRTVPYAAIHNYGGTIEIPEVTGKLMVFESRGEKVFTMRHRAFTVTMPVRNYMESSAEEQTPIITEGFRVAVAETIHA